MASPNTATAPTIRLVCATRLDAAAFFKETPLGRSIPFYRSYPRGQPIELRLFPGNTRGLPEVYNVAIDESRERPAILVFLHDDVYLSDYFWATHLIEGLSRFDVIGLAGTRRRVPGQSSWMYIDGQFTRDADENLSGVIGHGKGFPDLIELSVYGEPGQPVKLLDGVFIAVRSQRLIDAGVRFDPRFSFDFYDMDFCRQLDAAGFTLGTWPISLVHGSAGRLGGSRWQAAYRSYLEKYAEG